MQNIKINKRDFLLGLHGKLYNHKGILAISDNDIMAVPKDRFYDFLHDLGVLVEEAIKENMSMED